MARKNNKKSVATAGVTTGMFMVGSIPITTPMMQPEAPFIVTGDGAPFPPTTRQDQMNVTMVSVGASKRSRKPRNQKIPGTPEKQVACKNDKSIAATTRVVSGIFMVGTIPITSPMMQATPNTPISSGEMEAQLPSSIPQGANVTLTPTRANKRAGKSEGKKAHNAPEPIPEPVKGSDTSPNQQKPNKMRLRKRRRKSYSFKKESVAKLFKSALEKGMQLPPSKHLEDTKKSDDPDYCPYHRVLGHNLEECYVFKGWLERKIRAKEVEIPRKARQAPASHYQINIRRRDMPPIQTRSCRVISHRIVEMNNSWPALRNNGSCNMICISNPASKTEEDEAKMPHPLKGESESNPVPDKPEVVGMSRDLKECKSPRSHSDLEITTSGTPPPLACHLELRECSTTDPDVNSYTTCDDEISDENMRDEKEEIKETSSKTEQVTPEIPETSSGRRDKGPETPVATARDISWRISSNSCKCTKTKSQEFNKKISNCTEESLSCTMQARTFARSSLHYGKKIVKYAKRCLNSGKRRMKSKCY